MFNFLLFAKGKTELHTPISLINNKEINKFISSLIRISISGSQGRKPKPETSPSHTSEIASKQKPRCIRSTKENQQTAKQLHMKPGIREARSCTQIFQKNQIFLIRNMCALLSD